MNNHEKILIVEDDRALLKALVEKLSVEKFVVTEAVNGEEGLALALKDHPDLILLDIIMPKMDGMSMLKEIRADDWGKSVKVILLTNLSGMKKVSEALDLGTYEYLVKTDWKIEDVVSKVREELL